MSENEIGGDYSVNPAITKMKSEKTSIPIKKDTRTRFESYGRKSESWDRLINRILDEHDEMARKIRDNAPLYDEE